MKMAPKEIVKSWFASIDKQNFDNVRKLMAGNHQFHNPMTPAPIGTEEHIGMMQMMTGAFEGGHHIERLVEENGWVAAYGYWKGKHTGEFNGVAATGKEVKFSWADFFQLQDGKVANEYFEMNPMSIMTQIGAA